MPVANVGRVLLLWAMRPRIVESSPSSDSPSQPAHWSAGGTQRAGWQCRRWTECPPDCRGELWASIRHYITPPKNTAHLACRELSRLEDRTYSRFRSWSLHTVKESSVLPMLKELSRESLKLHSIALENWNSLYNGRHLHYFRVIPLSWNPPHCKNDYSNPAKVWSSKTS